MMPHAGISQSTAAEPKFDKTVYLVMEDYGSRGCAYREVDVERCDFESLISDLITGQFESPLSVIAFNARQGWSKDVSREVAAEIRNRSRGSPLDITAGVRAFLG
jgi:hypothetical protein